MVVQVWTQPQRQRDKCQCRVINDSVVAEVIDEVAQHGEMVVIVQHVNNGSGCDMGMEMAVVACPWWSEMVNTAVVVQG